jgi:hypothetical protein
MKSQGKRSEPQAPGRDPTPPEVAHDDSYACDAIHLAEECQRLDAGKVMQDLGAHHDVDALIGERQSQRVTAYREAHGRLAGVR